VGGHGQMVSEREERQCYGARSGDNEESGVAGVSDLEEAKDCKLEVLSCSV